MTRQDDRARWADIAQEKAAKLLNDSMVGDRTPLPFQAELARTYALMAIAWRLDEIAETLSIIQEEAQDPGPL